MLLKIILSDLIILLLVIKVTLLLEIQSIWHTNQFFLPSESFSSKNVIFLRGLPVVLESIHDQFMGC
jgi:hypothetical protein